MSDEMYVIRVRPDPPGIDRLGREPHYRLKLALKVLLRRFGLRSVEMVQCVEHRLADAGIEGDAPGMTQETGNTESTILSESSEMIVDRDSSESGRRKAGEPCRQSDLPPSPRKSPLVRNGAEAASG